MKICKGICGHKNVNKISDFPTDCEAQGRGQASPQAPAPSPSPLQDVQASPNQSHARPRDQSGILYNAHWI